MPSRPGCKICPFADDPETVCAAITLGHEAWCRSDHPGMPASVRKTTLQLLGRWAEPEPSLPSLPRQALNFAKAEARDVAAGRPRLDAAAVAARLAICRGDAGAGIQACPEYRATDDRCAHRRCGCYLGGDGKAIREVETCPLGKWPA